MALPRKASCVAEALPIVMRMGSLPSRATLSPGSTVRDSRVAPRASRASIQDAFEVRSCTTPDAAAEATTATAKGGAGAGVVGVTAEGGCGDSTTATGVAVEDAGNAGAGAAAGAVTVTASTKATEAAGATSPTAAEDGAGLGS